MYDTIIVGAGPAGNIAAQRLAEMNHKVAVVDSRTKLGDKLCTGIIGSECATKFPPQEDHIYRIAYGASVVSPSLETYRIERDSPQAVIIDRVKYVNSFAEHAARAGANYILDSRVTNLTILDSHAVVDISTGNSSYKLMGKSIIIASGFNSPLVKLTALAKHMSSDYMIGCQAELEIENLNEICVFLGNDMSKKSFGWLVPLSDNRALVGAAPRNKQNATLSNIISHIENNLESNIIVGKTKKWGIPLKPMTQTYSDRLLIVGDAAGLVKPITGGGIYYSLLSGELAGQTLCKAIENNNFSAKRLESYQIEWKELLSRELRIGYNLRLFFETLNDKQINLLLEEMLSNEALRKVIESADFSFDWHSKIISETLKHSNVAALLMSLGPNAGAMASRIIKSIF